MIFYKSKDQNQQRISSLYSFSVIQKVLRYISETHGCTGWHVPYDKRNQMCYNQQLKIVHCKCTILSSYTHHTICFSSSHHACLIHKNKLHYVFISHHIDHITLKHCAISYYLLFIILVNIRHFTATVALCILVTTTYILLKNFSLYFLFIYILLYSFLFFCSCTSLLNYYIILQI